MVTPAEPTSERKPRRYPCDGLGDLGVLAVQEQHIEIRTGGTANSDVTSQTVWSAAYINAAVLQDTYSSGTLQANSRLYFQQDANWDTTSIVGYDATTGTWGVTQRYVYDSYGNVTVLNADWSTPPAGTNPIVNNLYQGMTLDPVTGLYYERNRNYSPSLGTWTSQDPAGYINGANTYQFVTGNPVGSVDTWGLFWGGNHNSTHQKLQLLREGNGRGLTFYKTGSGYVNEYGDSMPSYLLYGGPRPAGRNHKPPTPRKSCPSHAVPHLPPTPTPTPTKKEPPWWNSPWLPWNWPPINESNQPVLISGPDNLPAGWPVPPNPTA
jgi:RHS repeat-associated protein